MYIVFQHEYHIVVFPKVDTMKQLAKIIGLMCILGQLIIMQGSLSFAEEVFEETSTENLHFVRGIVSSVSFQKMQLAVRPLKGKRIVIDIELDTQVEGVLKIEDLRKEQQVKVWYTPAEQQNKAIRIEKMMELGC